MVMKWCALFVTVLCLLIIPLTASADFGNEFKILASDGLSTDSFGDRVAVSGDTMIVGAHSAATTRLNGGSAYIFVYDAGTETWVEQQELSPPIHYENGSFGSAVAIEGDIALVGASGDGNQDASTPPLFSGAVYVYERSGDTWTMVQRFAATDATVRAAFGGSIAFSGNTAIVGGYRWGKSVAAGATTPGSAYIFTRDPNTGFWAEEQKLEASDGLNGDSFGNSVSIDGDTVVIGAIIADAPAEDSGAAYVFTRSGGVWTEQQKIVPQDGASKNFFGASVAVSGDIAIVGAYWALNNDVISGSAYVFTRSGDVWSESQKLVPSFGTAYMGFGNDLSMNGETLIVGAYREGAAYIFTLDSGTGEWTEQQKLTASDGESMDSYGWSVSLNGNRLVVGAPDDNDNGLSAGAGYVYSSVTGPDITGPDITVTDSVVPINDLQVTFGDITLGTTSDQTITVTNDGTEDLVLGTLGTTAPLATPFSLQSDTCSDQPLTSGANCTFGIRFAPTAPGPESDAIDIPSNDPDEDTVFVNVSGTGTAISVPDIIVTDSVAPNNDSQIPFGTVTVGVTSDHTVTVTNNGTADLVLGDIATANPLDAPFNIHGISCSALPMAPGESCALNIMFAPTAAGPFNESFDIPSNDPDEDPITFSVSGTGLSSTVPDITVTDAVAPNNDLQVPFGSASAGTTTDQVVTITNSGNGDLVLGPIASANPLAAPFSIQNNPCDGQTLTPTASCAFDVRFAPVAEGVVNESFDIPSDDPDEDPVIVNVSGTGSAVPVPDITVIDTVAPLDDLKVLFGEVTEGLKTDQTVTLSNAGNADLILGNIAVANPIAEPFAILNDTCSGLTLPPATDCTFDVSFAPVDASLSSDSFDIPSDDPDEASLTVDLNGTGLSAVTNNPPGKPRLVFPANGQEQLPTELTFQWRPVTDPDGDPVSYDVFYCTDLDPFQNCTAAQITSFNGQGIEGQPNGNVLYAGTGCGAVMLFFGFAFANRLVGRKRIALLIAMALAIGMLLTACNNHSNSNSDNETFTVTGLDSGTQHYWGVVAKDDQGGETQSEVWSFTTR